MSGYLICGQCHKKVKVLFVDPRTPPVDEGNCLCCQCHTLAEEECNEE